MDESAILYDRIRTCLINGRDELAAVVWKHYAGPTMSADGYDYLLDLAYRQNCPKTYDAMLTSQIINSPSTNQK